jgi:hypothetical protein
MMEDISMLSPSFIDIDILLLCGNGPYLLPVLYQQSAVFFYTYRCATGHILATKSLVAAVLVVSELRPSCLPKSRFYSSTKGDLYIKKIIMGDGKEESNY